MKERTKKMNVVKLNLLLFEVRDEFYYFTFVHIMKAHKISFKKNGHLDKILVMNIVHN